MQAHCLAYQFSPRMHELKENISDTLSRNSDFPAHQVPTVGPDSGRFRSGPVHRVAGESMDWCTPLGHESVSLLLQKTGSKSFIIEH